MGRQSGFVARNAALGSSRVTACLIPEVDFDLDGENGLCAFLKKKLEKDHHAVIVIAEGAGAQTGEFDASGNPILMDVGPWLKKQLNDYFDAENMLHKVIYIDPSYMIRSVAANSNDHRFCGMLAYDSVHAAMSGFTNTCVGRVHGYYVCLPIDMVVQKTRVVRPEGSMWSRVLEWTHQPSFKNDVEKDGEKGDEE
eukprot:TRINITY_DN10746_c0_g1_i1.p1 TRINITY_DN10746_c0_g1~~TRINITY_DN10746_c0_g1_i1.p1  ORF type:complete len:196 (-),score=61.88 TRINITY_DN10746_c0_g1_i1:79-666(-)